MELMLKTKPSIYRKFVTIKNGWMDLYVKLQKSFYGFLRSALLFYEKLVFGLKSRGFIINPYYPSVSNIMINGKHITITWNVN